MAARISEKESGKRNFYKESKSNKKTKIYGGWEGRGWGVARVSDFF